MAVDPSAEPVLPCVTSAGIILQIFAQKNPSRKFALETITVFNFYYLFYLNYFSKTNISARLLIFTLLLRGKSDFDIKLI